MPDKRYTSGGLGEVTMDPHLINAQDLTVHADYGQIYISWDTPEPPDDPQEMAQLTALDDARESGRFVGVRPGFIDVMTPGQWNFRTPLRLEVWSAEPPDDREGWDHEVDADLDLGEGGLWIAGPPAHLKSEMVAADAPPGNYRARISGRGFTELGAAGADGDDSYRLRLWPRDQSSPPMLRKRWPGWDRSGVAAVEPLRDRPDYDAIRRGIRNQPGHLISVARQQPPAASVTYYRMEVGRRGMIAVIAFDRAGRILLVPSHTVGDVVTEFPACRLDGDEDPLAAAGRVLHEAAGVRADTWNILVDIPILPVDKRETCRVYFARDISPADSEQSERTQSPAWVALDQAHGDVTAGVIRGDFTAGPIGAAVRARDLAWQPLMPADRPWHFFGSQV